MTVPVFLTRCHICNDHDFQDKRKCREHYKTKHSITIKSTIQGRPPKQLRLESANSENFNCPSCTSYFATIIEVGTHIQSHLKDQNSSESSLTKETSEHLKPTDDAETAETAELSELSEQSVAFNPQTIVTLSNPLSFPRSPLTPVTMEPYKRNYVEAILHACQRADDTEENKNLARYAIASLKLEPFSMINDNGEEENALAHVDVISRATQSKSTSIVPLIPTKRCASEMDKSDVYCNNCAIKNPTPLNQSLSTTPYKSLFRNRKYVELSEELCEFLNHDWSFMPQIKYAAAQLLSGCILQNQLTGKVIIANTVEVYGRKRNIDIHREAFGTKKQSTIPTSLPPPVELRYDNVYPVTLNSQHGPKLVVGTQTMNFLITSFLRLDKEERPSVGAVSPSFTLDTLESSSSTRIYVDEYALNKAMKLAEDKDAKAVLSYNIPDQLRQLGTRFDSPSTYYLCRASGFVTRAHQCQPYSIFTLSNFDRGRCPSAEIFSSIADEVLKSGDKGVLNKNVVKNGLSGGNKDIEKIIIEIIKLYKDNQESLIILGNTELNSLLEKLAFQHQPYISSANETVATAIYDSFNFF